MEFEKAIILKALSDIAEFRYEMNMDEIKISANVTGETVQNEEFKEFLIDTANGYDMEKMKFIIEVTEQDFLRIDDEQRTRFRDLHDHGYRFAIDDFTMGSTSLNYLTADLFDAIKLDGGLVKQVAKNKRAASVIASIIDLAQSLNMKTYAEYVSNEEILNKMKSMGCEYYQGWYYSPAISKEEFAELIKTGKNK